MKKPHRKTYFYLIIIAIVLFGGLLMASFAYFTATVGNIDSSNMGVQTTTLDSLVYYSEGSIDLIPTQDNFAIGQPNLTRNSTSTVTLYVNNTVASSYCYTIDLVVNSNSFERTISPSTEELVAVVAGEGISERIDITTFTGTYHIPKTTNNYKFTISGAPSAEVTHTYTLTITMINYNDHNQSDNAGKLLEGELVFTTVDC